MADRLGPTRTCGLLAARGVGGGGGTDSDGCLARIAVSMASSAPVWARSEGRWARGGPGPCPASRRNCASPLDLEGKPRSSVGGALCPACRQQPAESGPPSRRAALQRAAPMPHPGPRHCKSVAGTGKSGVVPSGRPRGRAGCVSRARAPRFGAKMRAEAWLAARLLCDSARWCEIQTFFCVAVAFVMACGNLEREVVKSCNHR